MDNKLDQKSIISDTASSSSSTEPPREGRVTSKVENATAKIPSMTWLWLAFGSMVLSAGLAATKEKKSTANFVGLWVPSLLLIGIYNKLVKLEASIHFDHRQSLH